MRTYDAIIVGLGGMGSAAAFELARRGRRVLALEQFAVGHDRGSSHGGTRVIRKAYYEHPDYVPLVARAFERWYDLEQLTGRRLLTECPCLSVGPPGSALLAGVRASAEQHSLPVEALSADELRRRFPAFRFGDGYSGALERTAGVLFVEECVRAHAAEAARLGAELREGEAVREWRADAAGVSVRTDAGEYAAAKLILTAGPWSRRLLGPRGAALMVMRQVTQWFGTRDDRLFRRDVFPVFLVETPGGAFYGHPALNPDGLKVARHYGAPELADPDAIAREPTAADEDDARRFLRAHLPDADGPRRRASVCTYTLTPDRHFVIDRHPDYANVVVAAGFSGHGFKFASAVGEALADLAEAGRTPLPVSLFRFDRLMGGEP